MITAEKRESQIPCDVFLLVPKGVTFKRKVQWVRTVIVTMPSIEAWFQNACVRSVRKAKLSKFGGRELSRHNRQESSQKRPSVYDPKLHVDMHQRGVELSHATFIPSLIANHTVPTPVHTTQTFSPPLMLKIR